MTDKKHPKENVQFVSLAMEMDGAWLTRDDRDWLEEHAAIADVYDANNGQAIVNLIGKTDEFLEKLGQMSEDGCSQTLISHLKYGRDKGVKFLFLSWAGAKDESA